MTRESLHADDQDENYFMSSHSKPSAPLQMLHWTEYASVLNYILIYGFWYIRNKIYYESFLVDIFRFTIVYNPIITLHRQICLAWEQGVLFANDVGDKIPAELAI